MTPPHPKKGEMVPPAGLQIIFQCLGSLSGYKWWNWNTLYCEISCRSELSAYLSLQCSLRVGALHKPMVHSSNLGASSFSSSPCLAGLLSGSAVSSASTPFSTAWGGPSASCRILLHFKLGPQDMTKPLREQITPWRLLGKLTCSLTKCACSYWQQCTCFTN